MATLSFNPASGANDPLDGWVGFSGASRTFSSIIGETNGTDPNVINTSGTPFYLESSTTTNQFDNLYRGFFIFDTSSIPSDAIITSAKISLYGVNKGNGLGSPDLHITSSNPASNSNLVNADFDNIGSTSFGNISYDSFSTTGWNDITLNASGLANINKGTGARSKFALLSSWDINGSFTGTWASNVSSFFSIYMSDNGSNKPTLEVTFTVPSTPNFFQLF